MWALLSNWFTPTSIFVIVNIVIGTIALISHFGTQKSSQQQLPHPHDVNSPQLGRVPSFLRRVKSINFSLNKFDQDQSNPDSHFLQPTEPHHFNSSQNEDPTPQLDRPPSFLDRLKSFNLPSLYRSEPSEPSTENLHQPNEPKSHDPSDSNPENSPAHLVERTISEPTGGLQTRQTEKMRKSESQKSFKRQLEDGVETLERRRPATARTERNSGGEEEGEIDAKADDFINRFKQQLKLQRLDSLLRYRDTLKGK